MRSSIPTRRLTTTTNERRVGRRQGGDDLIPSTMQQSDRLSRKRSKRSKFGIIASKFFRRRRRGANDTGAGMAYQQRRRHQGGMRFLTSPIVVRSVLVMIAVMLLYLSPINRFRSGTVKRSSAGDGRYAAVQKPTSVLFSSRHQRHVLLHAPKPLSPDAIEETFFVDYEDLEIAIFEEAGQARQIYHDFVEDEGEVFDKPRAEVDDNHDYYYAFDDDVKRNPLIAYTDDSIQDRKQCRRVAWHRRTLLNCNSFHELGLASNSLDGLQFKGAGSYRQVFATDQSLLDETETVIFKEYIWDASYDYADFEFMRMDAHVSEIFTSSPLIVDIYGFCGLSMLSEYLSLGDMEEYATPDGTRHDTAPLTLDDKDALDPRNSYTAHEKLTISLEMAESLALLHSNVGGVIVHDDVQLGQFLPTEDGHIKLNDFNRAEIMLWNSEDQEYCRYRNNPGNGDWRAPEEYADDPLNEKIDVWSLGYNMYAVLTGVNPFYDVEHSSEVQRKVRHGETPFIDPRWRMRSYAEGQIVSIMELCWKFNPDERVDIYEIVKRLRHALEFETQQISETSDTDTDNATD